MTDMDYAQKILDSASQETRVDSYRSSVIDPPTTEVTLPGGLYNPLEGELIKTAVVREINGWDEEILARLAAKPDVGQGEQLVTLLERATVSIGHEKASPEVLDMLYSGDWDALLLGIRIASFGSDIVWQFPCQGCDGEMRTVSVDLSTDINPRNLTQSDLGTFTHEGKRSSYVVGYPKGSSTRRVFRTKDLTPASVITATLFESIVSIDDQPVSDLGEIRSMPAVDRDAIFQKINQKMPSLRLDEVKKTCDDCGSGVRVPLSLAALFRGGAVAL
jgi:hypothetical protein